MTPHPTDALARYVSGSSLGVHRHFDPEIDKLYEEMKFESDPEKRREIAWFIDRFAMDDSECLSFDGGYQSICGGLRGRVSGSPTWSRTNARMEHVFLDFDDLPHARQQGAAAPEWARRTGSRRLETEVREIGDLLPWFRE